MAEFRYSDVVEEKLSTPIKYKTCVAVVGGGIAGISAALSASRCGADVLLIESQFALGGLATLGLITYYLPICDGYGHQVVYGIGEELLRLSVKHGAVGRVPTAWFEDGTIEQRCERRFRVEYNPSMFCLECERLLVNSGVRILYGTKVCGAVAKDGFIDTLIVENKSGRSAVRVNVVIDATGDSDVAAFCGAKTVLYKKKNTLAGWYYWMSEGERKIQMLGPADVPDDEVKAGEDNSRQISDLRFSGIDADEVSDMTILSHSATYAHIMKKRESIPDYLPTNITMIPQLRMTRRIVGLAEMHKTDDKKYFSDSVGLISDWRRRGPIYEVPFGAICSETVHNLFAAGRNISADDDAWDITRVIPPCAVTGEAAGTAAALSAEYEYDHSKIDVKKLQKKLTDAGVKLHTSDVL